MFVCFVSFWHSHNDILGLYLVLDGQGREQNMGYLLAGATMSGKLQGRQMLLHSEVIFHVSNSNCHRLTHSSSTIESNRHLMHYIRKKGRHVEPRAKASVAASPYGNDIILSASACSNMSLAPSCITCTTAWRYSSCRKLLFLLLSHLQIEALNTNRVTKLRADCDAAVFEVGSLLWSLNSS